MLRRIVLPVEILASLAVLIAVVLLFTNEPTAPPPAIVDTSSDDAASEGTGESEGTDETDTGAEAPAPAIDSAGLYGGRCAGCHGGDGSGGIGPKLNAGRVVARYPDPAEQILVVTDGRGGMPAFGSKLSAEEIAAIVDYTRTALAAVG